MWDDFEVISTYSRAEAIADGVLVDVTELAKEAGARWSVAVTQRLWEEFIVPDPRAIGQSEQGRLWDIFNVWAFLIRLGKASGPEMVFKVIMTMGANDNRDVYIKAIIGPGDTSEPVITFMLPDED